LKIKGNIVEWKKKVGDKVTQGAQLCSVETDKATVDEGNIVEWKQKVGDKLNPSSQLCSVETDKSTVDFEVNEEGYLAKILYPAGSKDIAIGEVINFFIL